MEIDSYTDLWNLVKDYCKNSVSDTIYSLWLKPLNLVSFEDNKVVLSASDFKANIVRNKFMNLLDEAFSETIGFPVEIEIVSENNNSVEKKEVKKEEPVKRVYQGDEFTFETFVIGNSNKLAYSAALAVAETPGHAYNPLFIYGNSGLGKTHLLSAICAEVEKNNPNAKILYTSGEAFTNELINSIEKKKMSDFHNRYRTVDVLLVDDIQFIGGKTQTQEEFFHTFNALANYNKQIVLTSDRKPNEIALLEDRIKTRFEAGLIVDIQPPDIETRIVIVKQKSNYYGLDMSEDVVQFIAEKIKNNVRQLEGAVKKLNAYCTISGSKPTISMAQRAIKDILIDNEPAPVTIDKILNEVSRTYGVTIDDLKSKKRTAEVSKARQAAMYIIREKTALPYADIGEHFGGMHHSSVMYNKEQCEKAMKEDSSVKATVESILNNIDG